MENKKRILVVDDEPQITLVLRSGLVHPLAFTVGLSSLALGTLLGSFVHVLTAPAVENEH